MIGVESVLRERARSQGMTLHRSREGYVVRCRGDDILAEATLDDVADLLQGGNNRGGVAVADSDVVIPKRPRRRRKRT